MVVCRELLLCRVSDVQCVDCLGDMYRKTVQRKHQMKPSVAYYDSIPHNLRNLFIYRQPVSERASTFLDRCRHLEARNLTRVTAFILVLCQNSNNFSLFTLSSDYFSIFTSTKQTIILPYANFTMMKIFKQYTNLIPVIRQSKLKSSPWL